MYRTHWLSNLLTLSAQRLLPFVIVAVLAFTAGAAVVAYGSAISTWLAGTYQTVSTSDTVPVVDLSSPIRTAASSAYDGQAYQAAGLEVVASRPNSPIKMAASSAYDGLVYQLTGSVVLAPMSNSPIKMAASSAYDGQDYHANDRAPASDTDTNPIRTAASSAYDGR